MALPNSGPPTVASILRPGPPSSGQELDPPDERACADLHLDQLVALLTRGREAYELDRFYLRPLADLETVGYRQDVFRDLDREPTSATVRSFGAGMELMRADLARAARVRQPLQKAAWRLAAIGSYCETVKRLAEELAAAPPPSSGMRAFLEQLAGYVASLDFVDLDRRAADVADGLARVQYAVRVIGSRVVVRAYRGEPDHAQQVEETFARFRQGKVGDHLFQLHEPLDMNPVEARILALVARLFPEPFGDLEQFLAANQHFANPLLTTFDTEAQFYLAYLDLLRPLREQGLPVCYPEVHPGAEGEAATDTFDLVLAVALAREGQRVVPNDYRLEGEERLLVITGPNQGGKTTFARAFGQLHHLAAIGCPVPGSRARVGLCDSLLTHFGREEDLSDLRGRLEEDVEVLGEILTRAGSTSVVVLNETFGSTGLQDARELGQSALEQLISTGAVGVLVTFVDELSAIGAGTVSMVSSVDPDDPTRRTFKVVRRPADGLAYALAIAQKYGLTSAQLRERLRR